MIDPADKETQALPLEPQKRGRGRPSSGHAMTPAEKQRAYRERQKRLLAEAHNLEATGRVEDGINDDLNARIEQLEQQNAEAKQLIKKLKADLSGAKDMLEHMKFRFEEQRAIADKFSAELREIKKGNVTEYAESTPKKVEETLQAKYKGKGRWVDIDRGSKEDIDARVRGLNQLASEGRTDDKYRRKPV